MSVAANREWIIDVGRGGEGGRIVASGTTETDLPEPESPTVWRSGERFKRDRRTALQEE
jgi:excinuclease UvrABC ATPase subunit